MRDPSTSKQAAVADDRLAARKPLDDDVTPVLKAADLDGPRMGYSILDYENKIAILARLSRAAWNRDHVRIRPEHDPDGAKLARPQPVIGIVEGRADRDRSRHRVDRVVEHRDATLRCRAASLRRGEHLTLAARQGGANVRQGGLRRGEDDVDRLCLHDRRQHARRRIVARADDVAGFGGEGADMAVDRRLERVPAQLHVLVVEQGLIASQARARGGQRRLRIVEIDLRAGALAEQVLRARHVPRRLIQGGLIFSDRGFSLFDLRLDLS